MITLKLGDIVNSTEILQKLAQRDMNSKLAWQVGRLLRAVEGELTAFNETRVNLIKKYGEKDEEGNLITDDKDNCKIPESSINTFSNELSELLESEVEVNARKLALSALENLDFTPADMVILEPFIEDDGEEEE